MKQLFTPSWGQGFAAGVLLCAAATLIPNYVHGQNPGGQQPGPGRVLHPPGTFMLSAAGGQSPGVYLIDTRTGDTWYIVPGGTWSAVGNPVPAPSRGLAPQK